jgi:DNA modification methylase
LGDSHQNKQLLGLPWRVAFALQADGWWLRSDIIWAKPNPMPESVQDRPSRSHEYIFLLSKNAHYFYDAQAIEEPISESYASDTRAHGVLRQRFYPNSKYVEHGMIKLENGEFPSERRTESRNKRSVWTIITQAYPEAHFATFPEELPKICILAGTRPEDTVLDPFAGSGTTGKVALELGRSAILIELNPS